MSLRGIDIASYQATLVPANMTDTDFIIVKATQGIKYINPSFKGHADGTLKAGKLLGAYHYVSGGSPMDEAKHFYQTIRPYLGKAVLAVDWEAGQNSAWGNLNYLRQIVQDIITLTCVRPLIYASASVYNQVAPIARELNCGLWVAQYATVSPTGWQSQPWNEGKYQCAVRQYSDNGRIAGYGAGLDLNVFYGDRNAWVKYATQSGATPQPAPRPIQQPQAPDLNKMASDTINGKYGNGEQRRSKLGRWYDKVMAIVNSRLRKPAPKHVAPANTYVVRSGDTLSGIASKHGTSWQSLARLNGLSNPNRIYPGQVLRLGGSAPSHSAPCVYVVRSGDTLSGIASRLHTSWQSLARRNHISNPNRIYPGQKIYY